MREPTVHEHTHVDAALLRPLHRGKHHLGLLVDTQRVIFYVDEPLRHVNALRDALKYLVVVIQQGDAIAVHSGHPAE